MSVAGDLDKALKAAGVPIVGVSIGTEEDRSTWQIQFAPEADDSHKAVAADLLTTFDPAAPVMVSVPPPDPLIARVDDLTTRLLAVEKTVDALTAPLVVSPPADPPAGDVP